MGFGDYPVEFNPKVHGPYDPARWYGKPDTPLSQVKLGELGGWLGRRQKSPQAMTAAISRGQWAGQGQVTRRNAGGPRLMASVIHPRSRGNVPRTNLKTVHVHTAQNCVIGGLTGAGCTSTCTRSGRAWRRSLQVIVATSSLFYVLNYTKIKAHRLHKYHW
ncbi:putative ATP synthase subunit f, mitochondrial [Pollicipes pollicipes]|uniref:putative ATP synthase subunit f, mitochondrial n=1 Tax=Pollicipes pollicipes TaxID=41117 RepID=UPI0018849BA5|nr:putative ATP synthase subunit f, mitochondrial [Pollicipes pollicipes]